MVRHLVSFIFVLAAVGAATSARADTIPDFAWEELMNPNVVNAHLETRLRKLATDKTDFDLRINTAKLIYILWRTEKKDNPRRIKLANLAIKYTREATLLRPNDAAGHFWLAAGIGMLGTSRGMLESLQLLPEIKKAFETSIRIDPTYVHGQALAHMGHLYIVLPPFPMSIGDKTKGVAYLKQAMKQDPNDTLPYLYLADLLWMEGKHQAALEQLAKMEGSKPDCAEQYFTMLTNRRKGAEMAEMIRKGEARHPLYDVTSDLQAALIH